MKPIDPASNSSRQVAPWLTRMFFTALIGAIVFIAGRFMVYSFPQSIAPQNASYSEKEVFLKNLSEQQVSDLIKTQSLIIHDNPLSITSINNLAVLETLLGNKSKSEVLNTLAASRTLHDEGLQVAATSYFLKKRDFKRAVRSLDVLIHLNRYQFSQYAEVLANLSSEPAGRDALVNYLVLHPSWRTELIKQLSGDPERDPNLIYGLLSQLNKAGEPFTREEMQFFLKRLINDHSYDRAYFVWLNQLSNSELSRANGVFDGQFEFGFPNRFFDWTLDMLPNVSVSTIQRDTNTSDHVLMLDFAPARTRFANLSQLMRLAAGDYKFSGEAKAENLANDFGMVWRMYCMSEKGELGDPIFSTEAVKGTLQWSPFSSKMTVRAQDCETQMLRLELNAKATLDFQISGRVYYDNLRVDIQE